MFATQDRTPRMCQRIHCWIGEPASLANPAGQSLERFHKAYTTRVPTAWRSQVLALQHSLPSIHIKFKFRASQGHDLLQCWQVLSVGLQTAAVALLRWAECLAQVQLKAPKLGLVKIWNWRPRSKAKPCKAGSNGHFSREPRKHRVWNLTENKVEPAVDTSTENADDTTTALHRKTNGKPTTSEDMWSMRIGASAICSTIDINGLLVSSPSCYFRQTVPGLLPRPELAVSLATVFWNYSTTLQSASWKRHQVGFVLYQHAATPTSLFDLGMAFVWPFLGRSQDEMDSALRWNQITDLADGQQKRSAHHGCWHFAILCRILVKPAQVASPHTIKYQKTYQITPKRYV